jgi:hypothetical protein
MNAPTDGNKRPIEARMSELERDIFVVSLDIERQTSAMNVLRNRIASPPPYASRLVNCDPAAFEARIAKIEESLAPLVRRRREARTELASLYAQAFLCAQETP